MIKMSVKKKCLKSSMSGVKHMIIIGHPVYTKIKNQLKQT